MQWKEKIIPLIIGYSGIIITLWAFSLFINDDIDWKILLILNPDQNIPIIDELMILITDFSMYTFGIVMIAWEIGYRVSSKNQQAKLSTKKIMRLIGIIGGIILLTGVAWSGYEYSVVFIAMGIIIFTIFWFIGDSYFKWDDKTQKNFDRVFWITFFALILNIIMENTIKNTVQRYRPLNEFYSAYNGQIRLIPDEIVRNGYSYVSGHSAALFALTTPLMWSTNKPQNKFILILWTVTHSFSRIYLACHFPFCALMGSIGGFSVGTLTYFIFRNKEN